MSIANTDLYIDWLIDWLVFNTNFSNIFYLDMNFLDLQWNIYVTSYNIAEILLELALNTNQSIYHIPYMLILKIFVEEKLRPVVFYDVFLFIYFFLKFCKLQYIMYMTEWRTAACFITDVCKIVWYCQNVHNSVLMALLIPCNKNVDIKISEHDTFLE